ncbi:MULTISPECIES: MmgE/PrpD family protein [unclassified Chelatococcus]|uniref:MmgE/PrpD family protein n=1 Tax=unclassified Chelatococcus TaxID=2638111 RepID=UPI001BCEEFC9|nr:MULTISPECIES: MmgE/PrpD family protein [unclassified Chelatococcus]MBS7699956.1 MmgE/PrpD family protein [Chelatococcus sp. YT9]MBX3558619.1 MmgE/PrpD family protein [Chelatococcus sp.]
MTGTVTDGFARLASELCYEDLSALAGERAKLSIIDAFGCILAGAGSAEAAIVRKAVALDGKDGPAVILGTNTLASPTAAAFANGTAGHAFDFDDSSLAMIGHPSVPMVAAAAALGTGRQICGRDIIVAYALGLEIAAGLGRRMNPSHYEAGWHATSTLGTLSAALAGARVAGLSEREIIAVIGVAASSSAGIRKNFGSMVKPLHAGMAARNGVVAVHLAKAGLATDPAALDGTHGFIDVFRGEGQVEGFSFGGTLEIESSGVSIKRFPCCGCTHSALDALLALLQDHRFTATEIESIRCTTIALVADILTYRQPTTPLQAKFSMEYCLAVAALDGACGLDQFEPDRVTAPDVQALMGRVATSVDPALIYRNGVYPSTVTVTLKGGRVFSRHVEEAIGHPAHPLGQSELEEKFLSCAERTLGRQRARDAFGRLTALEDVQDFDGLVETLKPG